MTQSMIGLVVGLAILIVVAFVLAGRDRREHPSATDGRIGRWLDSHHMGWMHRRH
ncbi:hypothetical protein [Caballeronia cordobensis]|uniref:hypothetical protein n=1 Tax=Caballeronia cordobensis TaxID=1353886 RepID=UPI00158EBB3A